MNEGRLAYIILEDLFTEPVDEQYQSIGRFDYEYIHQEILENRFSIDDVETAINLLAFKNIIQSLYEIKCRNCDFTNIEIEQDFQNKDTKKELKDVGLICKRCEHRTYLNDTEYSEKYCISQDILDSDRNPNHEEVHTLFDKIKNFFKFGG